MKNQFTPAAKPKTPPVPSDAVVKGFFRVMKTSAPGFLERMIDQYPGLLEAKGSPSGGTPLVYAAELGNLDLLKMLHGKGASLTASDNGDQSALFYAGQKGYPDIAMYLIAQGIDPTLPNKAGISPVAIARSDFPSFSERMEERRTEYLELQAQIAREQAIVAQKQLEENVRQITETVRHGTAGDVIAPQKASFRQKRR